MGGIQKTSGAASLRILDNNTSKLTEAARTFPAIRKGVVKFKLYAANLSDSFLFSLREPFSKGYDKPGIMYQFHLGSNGALRTYNSSGSLVQLPSATTLILNQWYDIELRFDTAADTCEIFINGVSKGTVGAYMTGNLINYFQVSSGSIVNTGTDVFIDDFFIQDVELSLPQAGTVGLEEVS